MPHFADLILLLLPLLASAQFPAISKRQCMPRAQVESVGKLTLAECMEKCINYSGNKGKCIAIEWKDGGKEQSATQKLQCTLSWDCSSSRFWKRGSIYFKPTTSDDCFGNSVLEFLGDCNYDNVLSSILSHGLCSQADVFNLLQVSDSNIASAQAKVEELCATALSSADKSVFKSTDIGKAGYQFDREFFNGGSEWNNDFNPDLSRIQLIEEMYLSKEVISFPEHIHNFNTDKKSCASNAAMCCWTADSSDAGDGSCADPTGCQDAEPLDNTDICYVNIQDSPLASHTKDGIAVYPGDSEGSANCMGFTWTNDEKDNSNLFKGNLLFEVAMRYGLKDNGYTRSVPHAPMCACVDQMPVVSRADCRDVEAIRKWSISQHNKTGLLNILSNSVDLTFNDCGGLDLATHYQAIHEKDISHRITGECDQPEASFLENKDLVEKAPEVEWVLVAGKGSFADPNNFSHKEQYLDGSHTSMTRADFEALWAKSNKILLRRCKYCALTHRYIYLKRYDDNGVLPSNVDLLNDVKRHWYEYANNKVHEDFDIFSTYNNAVHNKLPWLTVDFDMDGIGFPKDSGIEGKVFNQWNVWEEPLDGKKYGQRNVGFYVAVSAAGFQPI